MSKKIIPILALLLTTGCSKTQIESLDNQYSGCVYIMNSEAFYNVGVELHYDYNRELQIDNHLETKLNDLLKDLEIESETPAKLVNNSSSHCFDQYRPQTETVHYAFSIPIENHDALIEKLNNFQFNLTLNDTYYNKQYTGTITLPIIDLTEQAKQEE